MGAAGKRAHSATESKPPDGDRPPDPPEELLVLHLDDEDASDPEEVAIDSHGRVNGVTACVTTRDAHPRACAENTARARCSSAHRG